MTPTVYIDLPSFSIGGVESFSLAFLRNFPFSEYRVVGIETRGKINNANRIPEDIVRKIKDEHVILSMENFLKSLEDLSEKAYLLLPLNSAFLLEKIHALIVKKPRILKHLHIIAHLHSDGTYYYDPSLIYEPIISQFICVNQKVHDTLSELIGSSEKSCLINTPLSIFPIDISEKKYSKGNNPIRLVYFGRIENVNKNVFSLVSIAKKLLERKVNFDLKIIGRGSDLESLKHKFRKLNGDYSISFFDNLYSPVEVQKELFDRDVSILISDWEGGPLVVPEAMASGVVPVTFDVGNVKKMIDNNHSGLIIYTGDISSVCEKIEFLFNNREKLESIGLFAHQSISSQKHLLFAEFFEKLKGILETIKSPSDSGIRTVQNNLNDKKGNIRKWVKKTVPPHIQKRYLIQQYLSIALEHGRESNASIKKPRKLKEKLSAIIQILKER